MGKIRVDPKYFRHIVGRQGATILKWRENKVQIHLPSFEKGDHLAADEIVIEGDPQGVERTKREILQLVEKLENEKCKDVIIEPHVQHLLCTGYKGIPPPIRAVYDSFPKVSVIWPENQELDSRTTTVDNPARSVVQLRGDRQQVDAAAERLQKLIKQVIEDNHRQEIRIFKEFRPHIFGRGSAKIQKLLDDTKTRIQYPNPSDGSDVFTIIGREENVQQAIRQLEDLQKKLANVKEIIVSIPSELTTKFVGDQAPNLRSIREQCAGVHMRFVHPPQKHVRKGNQVEVVIIGPSEALNEAKKLLDQLNPKVAQLCAEELIHVDPKFHGVLIGRQGSNITRFRERHNVELLFPDRMETDPKLSMEIRIVGPKDAVAQAKADLEAMIKTLEDEVEQAVSVNPSLLKDVVAYRRAFPNPELDRVRVIMPRNIGPLNESTADSVDGDQHSVIKLIGQKACVESACQALQNMIRDIEEQSTKEFPLTEPSRLRRSTDNSSLVQGSPEKANEPHAPPSGSLFITGRPERIDQLYEEEIRPMLPIEEEFPVAQEFHRGLIVNLSTERRGRNVQTGPPVLVNQAHNQPKQRQTIRDAVQSSRDKTEI
ncbi:High-density lipoprotein receptor (Hdl) [Fasciola gigantica]|uniref:High-density lipoprotein receptor (Hdl) n=1 Tax=Fasciola gigantica TaxID=46835 RepID=A0A504Z0Z8_FASGI|nr:High-density lipoprotein receptor (Hdl) [Fasciola gigantica]